MIGVPRKRWVQDGKFGQKKQESDVKNGSERENEMNLWTGIGKGREEEEEPLMQVKTNERWVPIKFETPLHTPVPCVVVCMWKDSSDLEWKWSVRELR